MLHTPSTRYLLEGTVAETSNGSILQLFRSGSKFLWKTVSHDGGRTWAEPMATTIPNPNAKVNLLRLTNRTMALVFNDVNDGSARRFLRCVSTRRPQPCPMHCPMDAVVRTSLTLTLPAVHTRTQSGHLRRRRQDLEARRGGGARCRGAALLLPHSVPLRLQSHGARHRPRSQRSYSIQRDCGLDVAPVSTQVVYSVTRHGTAAHWSEGGIKISTYTLPELQQALPRKPLMVGRLEAQGTLAEEQLDEFAQEPEPEPEQGGSHIGSPVDGEGLEAEWMESTFEVENAWATASTRNKPEEGDAGADSLPADEGSHSLGPLEGVQYHRNDGGWIVEES